MSPTHQYRKWFVATQPYKEWFFSTAVEGSSKQVFDLYKDCQPFPLLILQRIYKSFQISVVLTMQESNYHMQSAVNIFSYMFLAMMHMSSAGTIKVIKWQAQDKESIMMQLIHALTCTRLTPGTILVALFLYPAKELVKLPLRKLKKEAIKW